ncbi:PREDICTED: uncharacterized protein LOC104803497 [Tarenaya hassleriana]|uniref:uncharacterized protein LOC104803497 n=1 Tax=Tarenaya hassleriana TaxID=28532 RepID=UPI00053C2EB6|nr:PREDICTED: uncharacterized protein LOC104803497 [Tarenaya hassleriana]
MEPSENTILQRPKLEKPNHYHQEDEEQETSRHQTQVVEEEEEEEALSLRDLPLKADQTSATSASDNQDPPEEFFEFLSSATCDVSPAENIIFRGKLIPLNDQNTLCPDNVRTNTSPRVRIRSESLPALQGHRMNRSTSSPRVTRNSRSLDYRKLTCVSSIGKFSPPEQDRKFPVKGSSPEIPKSSEAPLKISETAPFSGKSVRPRWYMIMFGMVKFPPEIELRDIKIRQTRRNITPVIFPSPCDRRSGKFPSSSSPSSSWRFLKALSCKEPTSVAATAPFWVPHTSHEFT